MKFLFLFIASMFSSFCFSYENDFVLDISNTKLKYYLSNPKFAKSAIYNAADSLGNKMECPTFIELKNQKSKYASLYHTAYTVKGGVRYKINLAVSNDLVNWTFVRMILDNADMPKIVKVKNSLRLLLVHEQWLGKASYSSIPSKIGYQLFYNENDLMSGSIRSTYLAPLFQTNINGTPSIYDAHLVLRDGYYAVDGQFGFHYWNGNRDINAVTTITNMFNPSGNTESYPSVADDYNNAFIDFAVTGNIGQRDTIQTTRGRFNIQEGNIGVPASSWDKWKIWLYEFWDNANYPTGLGAITELKINTHAGSSSFGNPSINIVNSPNNSGKAMIVSYFLFSEGAKLGEAGSLIYYFDIE